MKIAIASGKGGTGKTFFAVNLFYSLMVSGKNGVLLDCDAEEPNAALFFKGRREASDEVCISIPIIDQKACTYCGKCNEYCNYNAIFLIPPARIIRVLEELCHGCGVCTYVCNKGAVSEKEVVQGSLERFSLEGGCSLIECRMDIGVYSPVKIIRAGIKSTADAGLVIMDSPPGTSCPFIHTVAGADYVVLLTEPTPFALSDLRQSISILRQMLKPFGVVINKAGIGDSGVYNFIRSENIPLLMEIPFDRRLAESCARGDIPSSYDTDLRGKLLAVYDKIVL